MPDAPRSPGGARTRLGEDLVDVGVSPERRPEARAKQWLVPLVATAVAALLALLYYGLTTDRLPTGVAPRPDAVAPDFQLSTFDGQTVHLADLRGKPVVLNFWASWCEPCRDEQPAVNTLWQRYQSRGVVFVGINIQDTPHDALGFIRQYGVAYPVVSDPKGAVYIDYGVVGVPETYLVTREGKIKQKLVGPVDPNRLATLLEELLR